jgi:hypothetical protein
MYFKLAQKLGLAQYGPVDNLEFDRDFRSSKKMMTKSAKNLDVKWEQNLLST